MRTVVCFLVYLKTLCQLQIESEYDHYGVMPFLTLALWLVHSIREMNVNMLKWRVDHILQQYMTFRICSNFFSVTTIYENYKKIRKGSIPFHC